MKNSLTVLLLFFSSSLFAQNIVIKEPCPNHRPGSPNREAAHSYFDQETNKLYLTYMDKTKLYLKTYVDMVKAEEYGYARTEDAGLFNQVSDVVLKDQKMYYLFFANPSTKEFSVQSINLLDKSIQRYPQALLLGKDEFYLYSFSSQGHFYILTAIRKTSNTRLYEYNFSTKQFEMSVLNFESVKFPNTTKEVKLWDIISDDNKVSNYDPDIFKYVKNATANKYVKNATTKSEIDPRILSRCIKFYDQEGHLMITIDGYNNMTYVIDVDLETKHFIYNTFEFGKIGALSNEVQKNSYLFENVLLQVKVSEEKMLVSVVDLQTKEAIISFSCLSEDSVINFSNSPMYRYKRQKDLFSTEAKSREFKKVKKMLRICATNNVFIGAIRNEDDKIEITIGSYFVEVQGGQTMMGPGGMGGSSGSIGVGGPHYAANVVEYLYCFKSSLSKDFRQWVPGYIDESFYQNLLDKQKDLNSPSKAQTIFTINGSYFLGYFYSIYPNAKEGEVEDYYYVEKFGSK